MTSPANKSPSQRGRKAEGRTAKMIRMRPEAWAALDGRLRGRSDTRGRVIERMLMNPALPPEIGTNNEKETQNMVIDPERYYIRLADEIASPCVEIEPYVPAMNARIRAAAERIGIDVLGQFSSYADDTDAPTKIEWEEHSIGKGLRYNTRQWEMWLRREIIADAARNNEA